MSIVKMKKLSVIGLSNNKEELIKHLMDLGVVELNAQDQKLLQEEWANIVVKDGNEDEVSKIDSELQKISTVLETLSQYDKSKKPLIKTRRAITKKEFKNIMDDKDEIQNITNKVYKLHNGLVNLKGQENKIETNIVSLKPWLSYDIPVELRETEYTEILIGVVPSTVEIEEMRKSIEETSDKTVFKLIGSDADQHYISIISLKSDIELVLDCIRQFGFNKVTFMNMQGTASKIIGDYEKELSNISKEKESIEKEIVSMTGEIKKIECLYDETIIEKDRNQIRNRLLKTESSFYFDGYMPARAEKSVQKALEENGCYYEFNEIEEGEEAPVLLHNKGAIYPFEAITNLYALPEYTEIDPTKWLAPFYFIFFGMMLSDAAYGIIMAVACFILNKKFRLEGMMKKLINMFFWCGISTAIWGALFGGWFGDLPTVAAKTFFGIDNFAVKPLWFNPVNDPMKLLIFSFILGGIHLFLGMGIQAYMLIKDGKPFDALCDIGFWYILLIGLVLFGVGGNIGEMAITIGKYMSIVGALGLLLTGGRKKKGIFGKLVGGLGSLYDITSYLADILSYSRLLALGLATGVIAQVINTMGSLAGGGIKGSILLIVVAVFGHLFNIAINALGSFVHASRLQYVEFFGKFYKGGGSAFEPFDKKTKYVDIVKEEN
ncbi:V-type ATP synthase subunit I [Peptacetobacter sp.]|uniref:V-type ATP synthase subunit I n=1 Tax=Peptacetobacter sp. TaxID=2991975 RepID=UPI0026352791|nr:V-type ATP synthase subunit I [Peptacetobacter sp.]